MKQMREYWVNEKKYWPEARKDRTEEKKRRRQRPTLSSFDKHHLRSAVYRLNKAGILLHVDVATYRLAQEQVAESTRHSST